MCVEPQSGPPDALNGAADIVEPGTPLIHEMRWRWGRACGNGWHRELTLHDPLRREREHSKTFRPIKRGMAGRQ